MQSVKELLHYYYNIFFFLVFFDIQLFWYTIYNIKNTSHVSYTADKCTKI